MVSGAPDWTKTIVATTVIEGVEVSVEAARAFWEGKTKEYEDANFTSAESPRTLPVNTDLSRIGHDGYIVNDGEGDIKVQIEDPVEGWDGLHTLKKDEIMGLSMLNIKNIKLTWVADTGYRVMVV